MESILPLIAHLLGDFFLQNSEMAIRKRSLSWHYVKHCLIYAITMAVFMSCFTPTGGRLLATGILIASHALIDLLKGLISSRYARKGSAGRYSDLYIFLTDQILHVIIIIGTVLIMKSRGDIGLQLPVSLTNLATQERWLMLASIGSLILLCIKPSSVLIRKVLAAATGGNEDAILDGRQDGSGQMIGILERLIVLMLGLSGQIGAVGFVIAAKSVARFKQLEDRGFAEKYLIGTLLSMAIALLSAIIGGKVLRAW